MSKTGRIRPKNKSPGHSRTPDRMTKVIRGSTRRRRKQRERDEQPQQGRKGSINLILENGADVNGYLLHTAAGRGHAAADPAGDEKARSRKPGTSCSGSSGCGALGCASPLDPGVELTRSRVDVAASAAGVEFPGVRVEDPVALGRIELPRLRVHGTAIIRKGWDGRHRGGGRLIDLRLGPLRYRRWRGLEDP